MNKKQIGKIQLAAGIILLLLAIFNAIFVLRDDSTHYWNYITSTSGAWGQVFDQEGQNNITTSNSVGHVVSFLNLLGYTGRLFLYLFITLNLLLIGISAVLILQGLANMSEK